MILKIADLILQYDLSTPLTMKELLKSIKSITEFSAEDIARAIWYSIGKSIKFNSEGKLEKI